MRVSQTTALRSTIQLTTCVAVLWMQHRNGGTGRYDQGIALAPEERVMTARVHTKRVS